MKTIATKCDATHNGNSTSTNNCSEKSARHLGHPDLDVQTEKCVYVMCALYILIVRAIDLCSLPLSSLSRSVHQSIQRVCFVAQFNKFSLPIGSKEATQEFGWKNRLTTIIPVVPSQPDLLRNGTFESPVTCYEQSSFADWISELRSSIEY